MTFKVIVFPGSNCDLDAYHLVRDVLGRPVEYIDYRAGSLGKCEAVILPGGFTYGDYLRPGAIARFTPVMKAVGAYAAAGGLVLGICNGFQVLTEAGLLPGALYRNSHLRFNCGWVRVRVENNGLPFTCAAERGDLLKLPVAHGEGSYYAPPETLRQLEAGGQVVFRYATENGETCPEANPNGSVDNIAGVCSPKGNVLGLMPHPERAGEALLGSEDGLVIFNSICKFLERRGVGNGG